MRAASIPARAAVPRPLRSRRLLALAGDDRLVEQVRRGNEAAFEVVFERHGAAILGFCRHMLGSREEAEDAVQHTFAAAYGDLRRDGRRAIALKPWLFTIARNRCVSVLRARRERPVDDVDAIATEGLAEQVERRGALRRLLADLQELPDEQRAALLLTELGDLSHADVARVLGCEASRVKALVFRARSGLIARREAREAPCSAIREQLANLRGGSLRRNELRLHLRDCAGCRAYREQVKQQRRMLAVALPVAPAIGLKSSVLAAVGVGGASAGGLAGGLGGGLGGATVAKLAVAGVLAGGGAVAGTAVVESEHPRGSGSGAADAADRNTAGGGSGGAAVGGGGPAATDGTGRGAGGRSAAPGSDGRSAAPGSSARTPRGAQGRSGRSAAGDVRAKTPGAGRSEGRRRNARKALGGQGSRGRGPIETPPGSTPVRRGPPEKVLKALPPGKAKDARPPRRGGSPARKGGPAARNGGPPASGGPSPRTGGSPPARGGPAPKAKFKGSSARPARPMGPALGTPPWNAHGQQPGLKGSGKPPAE
jgi:RNA polymerase sigma factor (sigma-70 family)